MKVKFILDFKGSETNPADYKRGDEAELPDDLAWQLASIGAVKFVEESQVKEEIKAAKPAKKRGA